jgi:hypothetical protein
MKKKDKIKKKKISRNIAYVKQNIKKEWSSYKVSKLFSTQSYLGEGCSWADIYFIGKFKGKKNIWNCLIKTVYDVFENEIDDQVYEEVNSKYPERFLLDEEGFPVMIPCEDKKGFSKMVDNPEYTEEISEQFHQEYETVKKRIAAEGMDIEVGYEIGEESECDFGIILTVTVKDKWITKDTVENIIKEFNNLIISEYELKQTSEIIKLTEADLGNSCFSQPIRS